jgi:hypothetical protein
MDWDKLKSEVSSHLSLSDEDILAQLLEKTITRRIRVSRAQLRITFDQFATEEGVPVWDLIENFRNETGPVGIACRAALRLRDAPGDYLPVDVTSSMFVKQIDLLLAFTILTHAQHDTLLNMGIETISIIDQLGIEEPNLNQIAKARSMLG